LLSFYNNQSTIDNGDWYVHMAMQPRATPCNPVQPRATPCNMTYTYVTRHNMTLTYVT